MKERRGEGGGGIAQLYQDTGKAVVFVGYPQCGRDSW